jgi:hypothetical protein
MLSERRQRIHHDSLQESQASDRQDATNVIDPLQNGHARKAFCTGVVVREVSEQESESYNAVVHQSAPWSPSPTDLGVVVRPQLNIEKIWTERKNERGNQGQ